MNSAEFEHVAQAHDLGFLVWHFDADVTFAGNGRFNTDRLRAERQLQVFVERGDRADLDAVLLAAATGHVIRLDAELGHDRTRPHVDDATGRAEAQQRFLDDVGALEQQFVIRLLVDAGGEHAR